MFRRKKFNEQNSRGVAALEVALAMPAMLMTLFGTVEFGRAFVIRQTLANAAAEAARVGSAASCPRATEGEVKEAAYIMLASSGLMPSLATVTVDNAGGTSGTDVVVDISYDVQLPVLSKLISMLTDSEGIELTARVDAENE
ncbi:MAG TPA: TadE/TadG family type IV pilus assembly protein [Candidatus Binatia bacterium]|nr:TadE/TadG family type IV pilus assembly protein [Candidatus Binatia bacterium]